MQLREHTYLRDSNIQASFHLYKIVKFYKSAFQMTGHYRNNTILNFQKFSYSKELLTTRTLFGSSYGLFFYSRVYIPPENLLGLNMIGLPFCFVIFINKTLFFIFAIYAPWQTNSTGKPVIYPAILRLSICLRNLQYFFNKLFYLFRKYP